MQSHWVIWLVFSGVAYVSGNSCDIDSVTNCYSDLVHYESLAFPLYGKNAAKLDDTCSNINMSYGCIESFVETCNGAPECDEDCTDMVKDILSFRATSGLEKFSEDLCADYSAVREIYLENAGCLETLADDYAACHNDSQKSQHFVSTLGGPLGIDARCCYFTWYQDCFTNATRYRCGDNGTFFVSFALHQLVGKIANMLCSESPVSCDRPPLPPEDDALDKLHEIDNEIDNDIHPQVYNSATIQSCVMGIVILSHLTVMLFKHFM